MRVSIIGSGVVGRATGLSLAVNGHDVLFQDIDRNIPRRLPNWAQFTSSLSNAYEHGKVLILCLPTPSNSFGGVDDSIYQEVIEQICRLQDCRPHLPKTVIQKSTLPPGTARRFLARLRDTDMSVSYLVNPELLNAGTALHDACSPNKVLIGLSGDDMELADDTATAYALYNWLSPARIHLMTYEEAELAKYVNNLFHALLISMWNELQIIAERQAGMTGPIDMDKIARLTALEPGLESVYRVFGKAWGGMCLPKDTRGFLNYALSLGYLPQITDALIKVNDQIRRVHGEQTLHWHELHKD